MLAQHFATGAHQWSRAQGWGLFRQIALENRHVIVVRYEADLDRFRLVRSPESKLPGDGAGFQLGEPANRRKHPGHDSAIDSPQEIALVFGRISSAVQRAITGDRVVSGR